MIAIQYPDYPHKIKHEQGVDFIFDPIRKNWYVLTPEEWVRQNMIQVFIKTQKIPAAYIAIEKELMLGELKKRFDLLIFDKQHKPWMIVECKAPEINLSEKTLNQVLIYNQKLDAKFIVMSNGHFTRCFQLQLQMKEVEFLPQF